MNIFYLDHKPRLCAQWLHDKHVVKMTLETAQLLSTAHRELDSKNHIEGVYKSTHKNHPCAKWVRFSNNNYTWTYALFKELCKEYRHRFDKIHKCWIKLGYILVSNPKNINVGYRTLPPECMPDQYKTGIPMESYKAYYVEEKLNNNPKWTNRNKPEWMNDVI